MDREAGEEWLRARVDVSRGTLDQLAAFVELLCCANEQQNLIARSTTDRIWTRHVIDSAQLLPLAKLSGSERWLDVGTGAGFPGLVVAILSEAPVTLAEPRRKRVEFLQAVIDTLDLGRRVQVAACRVETLATPRFDIISARAFAPLDRLLPACCHLAAATTRWLLPKGRGAQSELDYARRSWHGRFSVVPSDTDPDASIIVAEDVRRKEP